MVVSSETYEECRKKRLEENKKRMEDLNLTRLSKHLLSQSFSTPKSSPMKPRVARKHLDLTPVRRSSRVSDKPPPNYKEMPIEPLGRIARSGSYGRRDLLNRVYASDEGRINAIERAELLESNLGSEFPSFVKPMLQSHVTGGFWLGLPMYFCKTHLPSHDIYMTLVDEDENESQTKYLAQKTGLSGGWRGFSIEHELVDGDALVFQLIDPTTFKVYIIRVNDKESDEASVEATEEAPDETPQEAPDETTEEIPAKNSKKRTRTSKR